MIFSRSHSVGTWPFQVRYCGELSRLFS